MKDFIIERLKERSTWFGVIGLITAAGININPESLEVIVTIATSTAGLLATITPDKK